VVTAAREDTRVRLTVRDDGRGIDPAALPRIFEPFYTGDDVQGSGLGLAIASELAGRMSGELSVHSRRGETTFTLEIPPLERRRVPRYAQSPSGSGAI
jgi:signal transduction histidine kinase